jgi:hypothetical protein
VIHCIFEKVDDAARCPSCGYVVTSWIGEVSSIVKECSTTTPTQAQLDKAATYRSLGFGLRLRTDEEYVEVTLICQGCENFESVSGVCKKLSSGCRACQKGSEFAKWKKSGQPCPVGKFPATLLEPLAPKQEGQ